MENPRLTVIQDTIHINFSFLAYLGLDYEPNSELRDTPYPKDALIIVDEDPQAVLDKLYEDGQQQVFKAKTFLIPCSEHGFVSEDTMKKFNKQWLKSNVENSPKSTDQALGHHLTLTPVTNLNQVTTQPIHNYLRLCGLFTHNLAYKPFQDHYVMRHNAFTVHQITSAERPAHILGIVMACDKGYRLYTTNIEVIDYYIDHLLAERDSLDKGRMRGVIKERKILLGEDIEME